MNIKATDMSRLSEPLSPMAEIAAHLHAAARIAERIEEGRYPEDRIDSAAWSAHQAEVRARRAAIREAGQ